MRWQEEDLEAMILQEEDWEVTGLQENFIDRVQLINVISTNNAT